MNNSIVRTSLASLSLALSLAFAQSPATVPVYKIDSLVNDLPDGQTWIDHIDKDLMKFWLTPEAMGNPIGNFPTYRAENGKVVNPGDPLPPSYQAAKDQDTALFNALIKIDRNYIRAHARQTYAYGVAYHMTGKEQYLELARAGVDYLRKNAVDRKGKGGAFSYLNKVTQKWGPEVPQRTSQDMAYALSGIGFYYYLTRDPVVLGDIKFIKDHIFKTYYDKEMDLLRWVVETSPDNDSPDQRELVSQLDQVYAYMLWLTPALPADMRKEWTADLVHLSNLMIKHFFSTEYGMFWGQITTSGHRYVGAPHTDFGHSIKTLWLIGQVGKMTGNTDLVEFSRIHSKKIIDIAYVPKDGSWARRFDEKGKIDYDKEWWILAELDQTTATMALNDPSLARYLGKTYKFWRTYMVDTTYGEIWHMVDGKTYKPILKFPKAHSWKNALHSTEHALVSYMTTQQLKNQPITLYYAFKNKKDADNITPYFFSGDVASVESDKQAFTKVKDLHKYTVRLTDLR